MRRGGRRGERMGGGAKGRDGGRGEEAERPRWSGAVLSSSLPRLVRAHCPWLCLSPLSPVSAFQAVTFSELRGDLAPASPQLAASEKCRFDALRLCSPSFGPVHL